ncbi:MAG: hypothetical protein GX649_08565 [Chloroflexi bacterium]|nr:hypothetical protein [Chloroflexota bacterium]
MDRSWMWRRPLAVFLAVLLVAGRIADQGVAAGGGGDVAISLPQAAGEHPPRAAAAAPAPPDARSAIGPLPVPYYSQRDERWGCEQIGTCTCDLNTCTAATYTTIADAGCYPTSQAMLFAYYGGGAFMDPGAYNRCLLAHGGYTAFPGACSNGLCGALDDPPAACRPPGLTYLGPSMDRAVLDADLANGHPAIAVVGVGIPGRLPHAVVVTGKRGGNYTVHDPYYDRREVSPGEIYGFHRWQGPGVALPQAGAAGPSPAVGVALPGASAGVPVAPDSRPSAAYAADITVPDGAVTPGGRGFTKTWRVRNAGSAAWPEGTRLVHVGREALGLTSSVPAPALSPGETGDVSVYMRAPRTPGDVRSDWRLVAPDGEAFGPVLYVEISVDAPHSPERRNWSMFEVAAARGRL